MTTMPDGKRGTRELIAVITEEHPEALWREAIEHELGQVPITGSGGSLAGVLGWASEMRIDGCDVTMLVTWTPGDEPITERRPVGGRMECRIGEPWLCPVIKWPARPRGTSAIEGGGRVVELLVGIPMPEVAERLAEMRGAP